MQIGMKSVRGRGSRGEALTSSKEALWLWWGADGVENSKALSGTGAEQSLY